MKRWLDFFEENETSKQAFINLLHQKKKCKQKIKAESWNSFIKLHVSKIDWQHQFFCHCQAKHCQYIITMASLIVVISLPCWVNPQESLLINRNLVYGLLYNGTN